MSTVRSEIKGWPWPLVVRVHPRARRLKLRLDSKRGEVVLTCPPRASRTRAVAWAQSQSDWVLGQVDAVPKAEPFVSGATIPFNGSEVTIDWLEARSRIPKLDGERLLCGGSREALPKRIEAFLRRRARDLLSGETAEIAERVGVKIASVAVGDAGTRWGSCSADGALRFSWRLVMAPPDVRRWVVAHEVAHRVHMNHGAAFHRLEEELYGGDCRKARSALRRIGPRLKRIGLAI